MSSAVALRLEEVSLNFGAVEALRQVSLSIPPRSIIALVGPSGAGKTSLLRILGASLLPSSGRMLFGERATDSLSLAQLRQTRGEIGFIHQRLDLVPNLRVFQNVIFGKVAEFGLARSIRETLLPSEQVLGEVYRILERLGITDKMYARTDRLSGGQLQRVAIARALFQSPSLILADEPISSVDPARARATIELLSALAQEQQTSLVVSLHNFELASEFFPRLIGIHQGKVLFDAAPEEITPEMRKGLYELGTDELLA